MRFLTLILLCLFLGFNLKLMGQPYTFNSFPWQGTPGSSPTGAAGFSPTNIAGITYYWNYQDLAPYAYMNYTQQLNGVVNTWTDRVNNLVLKVPGTSTVTNLPIGVALMYSGNYLTNLPPINSSSNFSWWIEYRPNTNYLQTGSLPVFGNNQSGLAISNNLIGGIWGTASQISSASVINYGAPINPSAGDYDNPGPAKVYDIVDSGGTLYVNGVLQGTGVGQPTNNFPFQQLGNTGKVSINGTVKYMAMWTNTLIGLAGATNLYNWGLTNGVTNVTAGLISEIKFGEQTGSNVFDSVCLTNNGYIVGTNWWTNGISGCGIHFTGSNYVVLTNPYVADNLTNFTICMWVNGNSFSGSPTGAITGGGVFIGKMALTERNLSGAAGPGDSSPGFNGWDIGSDNGSDCFPGIYQATNGFGLEGGRPQIQQYDNTWHFIAVQFYNSANYQIENTYLDGCFYQFYYNLLGGTWAAGGTSNTNGIMIGSDAYHESIGNANMGLFRIYNRILSPQEIEDLHLLRQ
jgi:hypothetical protein